MNEEMIKGLKDYLKSKGYEITDEQAQKIIEFYILGKEGKLDEEASKAFDLILEKGELSENELETVAGGGEFFHDVGKFFAGFFGNAVGLITDAAVTVVTLGTIWIDKDYRESGGLTGIILEKVSKL